MKDDIDRQIVALLLEDGRLPTSEIARRVSLSVPATSRRIARLERDGVIAGYSARLGAGAQELAVEAFVELLCEDRTSAEEIGRSLARHPEVIAAYTVTGDPDALLHIRTTTTDELERCLERVRREKHVTRTRTQLVLTRLFERSAQLPSRVEP